VQCVSMLIIDVDNNGGYTNCRPHGTSEIYARMCYQTAVPPGLKNELCTFTDGNPIV